MKKLYRKGTVHPSSPPQPQPQPRPPFSDYLEFLPAAILTLAAALSVEDREVLAYLISCSSSSAGNFPNTAKSYKKKAAKGGSVDHSPAFNCNCFRCYMSYWVRWDSSPNRQLIHEIIDAFEDGLLSSKNIGNNKGNNSSNRGKRERKKKGLNFSNSAAAGDDSNMGFAQIEMVTTSGAAEVSGGDGTGEVGSGGSDGEAEEKVGEKGPMRQLVSFIGESIWGVWA